MFIFKISIKLAEYCVYATTSSVCLTYYIQVKAKPIYIYIYKVSSQKIRDYD